MNDITALMATMRVKDIPPDRMEWLKKLADMEYCASNPGHWLMDLKDTNYLAALALQCLERNLALVEALEKAQQQNVTQREYYDGVIADGSQRIAELESRTVTVKLSEAYGYLRENNGQFQISIGAERPSDRSGGYATPWFAIYTATGIQVIEGEQDNG